jgi:hypothetical protein
MIKLQFAQGDHMQTGRIGNVVLVSILLFLFLWLTGCAATGSRFYSGAPRQANHVAVFVLHRHCYMNTFTENGALQKKIQQMSFIYEALPGNHALCVGYHYKGDYSSSSSQGCYNLKFDAKPGHVYYIYPSFPSPGQWKPLIVDFANEDDYAKFDNGVMAYTDNGSDLKARVEKYLKGERRLLMQNEHGTWQ